MINEGESRICFNRKVYDAALGFYGKWLEEKKEAQERPPEKDPPLKSGG